jgi:hypothetical protein
MNRKEAEKVVRILLTADGGCEYCVSSLLKLFSENFPEFKELAQEAFRNTFNMELEDFIKEKELGRRR